MKHPILPLLLTAATALTAACGEDRSGEQPFAPTVESLSAEIVGDSARLTGVVTSSVNSTLTACGFEYGNDTLRLETAAPEPATTFTAVTDSLGGGDYFAVAYATNGVGKSYGDTIYFTIP